MSDRILCDGEIVRHDDDTPAPIQARSLILPALTATAFILGLLAGLAF